MLSSSVFRHLTVAELLQNIHEYLNSCFLPNDKYLQGIIDQYLCWNIKFLFINWPTFFSRYNACFGKKLKKMILGCHQMNRDIIIN